MSKSVPEGILSGEIFRELFENDVKFLIAWDALSQSLCEAKWTYSRSELGTLQTPWYFTPDGKASDWCQKDAKRATVREVAEMLKDTPERLPEPLRRHVGVLVREFHKGYGPIMLPALNLPHHKLLIDGNHRAVALYSSSLAARALIVTADHPNMADVCIDALRDEWPVNQWDQISDVAEAFFISS